MRAVRSDSVVAHRSATRVVPNVRALLIAIFELDGFVKVVMRLSGHEKMLSRYLHGVLYSPLRELPSRCSKFVACPYVM